MFAGGCGWLRLAATTWPLPASFAPYSAWSARWKNAIASSSGWSSAMPADIVSGPAWPTGFDDSAVRSRA